MWDGRLSTVKVLYFFNRYTAPIVLGIDVYDKGTLSRSLTTTFCQTWLITEGCWTIVSLACIHWLVILRVWSLYGRTRPVLLLLTFLFLVYFAATVTLWVFGARWMKQFSAPSSFNLCVGRVPSWMWTIWIPSLFLETALFILLLIKAIQHNRKRVNTPVLSVLYFDGFLYFLVISFCSLYNMFVWLFAPPTLVLLSKYWTTSVCIVAGSRLVLDLRNVHYQYSQGTENFEMLRTAPAETWKTMQSFANANLTAHFDMDDSLDQYPESAEEKLERSWSKSSQYHTWETNYPRAI